MSVEIQFPVEFVVQGTPVSLQAKRRESIREWQATVKRASRTALPEEHFAAQGPIAITLYYFSDAPMQGDIDNIVKPILDALNRHIYVSDHQVERVLVQQFEPEHVFRFEAPSLGLRDALQTVKPALYVRLSDDPFEDLR